MSFFLLFSPFFFQSAETAAFKGLGKLPFKEGGHLGLQERDSLPWSIPWRGTAPGPSCPGHRGTG